MEIGYVGKKGKEKGKDQYKGKPFKGGKGKDQVKGKSDKREADKNTTCFHCGKFGHMKKDCRSFLRDGPKGKGGKKGIHEIGADTPAAGTAEEDSIEVAPNSQWLFSIDTRPPRGRSQPRGDRQ